MGRAHEIRASLMPLNSGSNGLGDKASSQKANVKKHRISGGTIFSHLFLILSVAVILFPILWVYAASFRLTGTLYTSSLFPKQLTLSNYTYLFRNTDFWIWVKNSIILAVISGFVAVCLTSASAYVFSRLKFRGKQAGLVALVLLQMFPATMGMVAIYNLLSRMQLINTLAGMILVYSASAVPFATWLTKGFFDGIPFELEEAAVIDGASRWQSFIKILIPLAQPILVVVFILNFIGVYNDFMLPSVLLRDASKLTMALGLRQFVMGNFAVNWSVFAAASTIGSLPIMIVYLALQNLILSGLTRGATKG